MKTKYKHIHFEKSYTYDREEWECVNNKDGTILGVIYSYKLWKRFVFEGRKSCIFDTSCLADIIDFMNQLGG